MLNNNLAQQIKRNFSFPPTKEQEKALISFISFINTGSYNSVFLLRGYAGTGKTALASAIVTALHQLGQSCILLAPTGRAAKVLSRQAHRQAFTIHQHIYRRPNSSIDAEHFSLGKNNRANTLYIIDEASMISNDRYAGAGFGSGCLLEDLITFVYGESEGCRMMLIGDTAQLPPVGQSDSPALNTELLSSMGLDIFCYTLTEVVRQETTSGILYNATLLRQVLLQPNLATHFRIDFKYPEVINVSGEELIDTLQASYNEVGLDDTLVICRSNKRANQFNQGIRSMILMRDEELNSGDLLMVARNNYFWGTGVKGLNLIANGDTAIVKRVRHINEFYGLRFADVLISFPDYADTELEVKIILTTLHSESPTLTSDETQALYNQVMADYADLPSQRERLRKLKSDPFLNALQVKYAYAITCHKAQGGQWSHVYIDRGYIHEETKPADYYRWLYTAFTRATDKLYLINWTD